MSRHADGVTYLPVNGESRSRDGVIATLVRGAEVESRHFPGPAASESLAAYCDKHGWRVRTISTPQSIYRDLQGTREHLANVTGRAEAGFDAGRRRSRHTSVEAMSLGGIKRTDLLEIQDSAA